MSDTRSASPRDEAGRREDSRWYTANRVFLSDGLLVIDYDMVPRRFTWAEQEGPRADIYSPYWDGWFYVDGSLMNGERLTTVDPFTRKPVTQEDVERGSMPRANRS